MPASIARGRDRAGTTSARIRMRMPVLHAAPGEARCRQATETIQRHGSNGASRRIDLEISQSNPFQGTPRLRRLPVANLQKGRRWEAEMMLPARLHKARS